jgi:DNA-binding NtrC family response regulator
MSGSLPRRTGTDDIPALTQHFIAKHATRAGRAVYGIAAEAEAALMEYHWPGNVRQLQNVIEQAVVMGSRDTILKEDLPEELLHAPAVAPRTYGEAIQECKRQLFQRAFDRANGNYREVALLLGLHPKSVHRHLRNLNLTYLLRQ